MPSIVKSIIRSDERSKGRAGLIIAEHIFDDGQVWPAIFDCGPEEDAQARLDKMIQDREAQRAENDGVKADAEMSHAIAARVSDYVKALPDKTLTDAGFLQEEVDRLKGVTAPLGRYTGNETAWCLLSRPAGWVPLPL